MSDKLPTFGRFMAAAVVIVVPLGFIFGLQADIGKERTRNDVQDKVIQTMQEDEKARREKDEKHRLDVIERLKRIETLMEKR